MRTRWTHSKLVNSVPLTSIVTFYLQFGLSSEIFSSYFLINILHVLLTSPIYLAADLTTFKPTHYMLELGRAMKHRDRCCVRRLGIAHVTFLSTNVAHTDRHTHTHKHTHTHILCGTVKFVYLWSQEQGFHYHFNPNMFIRFRYSCYMFISSYTNFSDRCNKTAGEW
jgi:hypothetical protein